MTNTAHLPVEVRPALSDDAPTLVRLIEELAAFEKLGEKAKPSAERLAQHLAAGDAPSLLLAYVVVVGGEIAGYVIGYPRYSTFTTSWDLHIEDLYVRQLYRGQKLGERLLRHIVHEARRLFRCERLHLNVLTWNAHALSFYQRLGGDLDPEWNVVHLAFDNLAWST